MAYEIFDDAAFTYLAFSVLAAVLLPWSAAKLYAFVRRLCSKPEPVPLTRIQKLKLAQQAINNAGGSGSAESSVPGSAGTNAALLPPPPSTPRKPWLTCGNVSFALLWLLFLYMLLQIPNFKEQNLATFEPFEILGVDKGATDEQIKRAYRKQSLLFHPDRNPSPEAEQQFILVAKAYETLTSETAKANIEKYGNPDGYQGVSVTIGLPSMLTRKENEMRVLVVYFFLFMVLPPLAVWIWWRRAKEFLDGGLLKKTMALWWRFMLPNLGSKFAVELLAIAAENEVLLSPQFPTDVGEFKKLAAEVKPHMAKQRFQDATKFGAYFQYAHKAAVLLHAYMLRMRIPDSMRRDLDFLLKDAHRFLGAMLDIAWAQGFVRTLFGLFDLMQLLTQGLFAHDSPLLQLPHLTQDDVRKLGRKNVKSVHGLLKAPHERLAKLLPHLSDQQWSDIRLTAELIPDVSISHSYGVEDEEGLYEGDLVTLRVKLERQSFDPDKPESVQYRLSDFEGDESVSAPPAPAQEPEVSPQPAAKAEAAAAAAVPAKAKKSNREKFAQRAASSAADDSKDDGAKDAAAGEVELAEVSKESAGDAESDDTSPSPSSPSSPSSEGRELTDDEILDSIPLPSQGKTLPSLGATGPSVHSLTFPHAKQERWFVLLLEKSSKKADRVVALHKVPSLFDEAELELKFLAPRHKSAKEDGLRAGDGAASLWQYELHAICDSYVGADQMAAFTLQVSKARPEGERAAADKVASEYEELQRAEEAEENGEEEVGPWYYLYFPSFWELALNVAVLALLCVFIFNFLWSRGYWQRYVQPVTDLVASALRPVWDLVRPVAAPLLDPLQSYAEAAYGFVADLLHRDLSVPHPDDFVVDEDAIPGMGQED